VTRSSTPAAGYWASGYRSAMQVAAGLLRARTSTVGTVEKSIDARGQLAGREVAAVERLASVRVRVADGAEGVGDRLVAVEALSFGA
jgi:hypothetical protein